MKWQIEAITATLFVPKTHRCTNQRVRPPHSRSLYSQKTENQKAAKNRHTRAYIVSVKAEDGWTHMGQWGEVAKLPPTITRSGVYSK